MNAKPCSESNFSPSDTCPLFDDPSHDALHCRDCWGLDVDEAPAKGDHLARAAQLLTGSPCDIRGCIRPTELVGVLEGESVEYIGLCSHHGEVFKPPPCGRCGS